MTDTKKRLSEMNINIKRNNFSMKKLFVNILMIILIISAYSFPNGKGRNPLNDKYKKWFEEEIVYIITTKEKEIFLKLKTDRERDLSDKKKAFKVENFQLYPFPQNDFFPKDNLTLFFQIFGLSEELKEKGSLEIVIYKGEEKFQSQHKALREYESLDFFLEEFSLVDFPPAYYKVRVSFFDEDENEILFKESRFSISPVASLPRPWINSIVHTSSDDPGYFYVLGSQLFNKKEALKTREKSLELNPNREEIKKLVNLIKTGKKNRDEFDSFNLYNLY